MRIAQFLIVTSVICLLAACTKYETQYIPDNTIPPDETVSDVKVENYANKVYISLLGREATATEMEAAKATLRQNNVSADDRKQFIASVLADSAYYFRVLTIATDQLIRQSIDTNFINLQIDLYTDRLNDPQYANFRDQILYEIDRYTELKRLEKDYINGLIELKEVHRRLVNNLFYDDINMGTTNFVISCFENFLFRSPTGNELADGENMVNGLYGQFLLIEGRSKDDFLDIFFSNDLYYEGQVRTLFKRYLFREPNSEESAYYTARFSSNLNYEELQTAILSLNEYAEF
ncbi:MAG: hypothetical protein SFW35_12845 [Chitinophagales bacterium]|nr:hypothetical protein [Chitinophagales bacterium]